MDFIRASAFASRLAHLALFLAVTLPAMAQEKHPDATPPTIAIGSRVRFTESRGGLLGHLGAKRRVTGEITGADDASITI